MLDTVRFDSPEISGLLYNNLKSKSLEKLAINNETEKIIYTFTSNDLVGSFDNRIMIQIKEMSYQYFFSLDKGKYVTELLPCKPYLTIELSLHKFLHGHNICNGVKMIQPVFKKVIKFLSSTFHCVFPSYLEWTITRLDIAETFHIENIVDYFKYLKNCDYSRRKIMRYDTAIFIPGTTTSVRIYSKEHEFKVHDAKKLKNNKNIDIVGLLRKSKNMLRCEVQINKKKLLSINGGNPMKVKNYNLKLLESCYEKEVLKLFQLKEHNRVYNDAKSVKNYLYNNYDNELASTLFSTYSRLCMFGKDEVKKDMSERTFYRHMKFFKDAGISFTNSDIKLDENVDNPYKDFIPTLDSVYKIS